MGIDAFRGQRPLRPVVSEEEDNVAITTMHIKLKKKNQFLKDVMLNE